MCEALVKSDLHPSIDPIGINPIEEVLSEGEVKAPCDEERVLDLVEEASAKSLALVVAEPEKVTPLKMVLYVLFLTSKEDFLGSLVEELVVFLEDLSLGEYLVENVVSEKLVLTSSINVCNSCDS